MKDIASVKNLHLGHLAKSFGLRDSPKDISNLMSSSKTKKPSESEKRKVRHACV